MPVRFNDREKRQWIVIVDSHAVDSAVAQGGAYEIIRQRLVAQGQALAEQTAAFNQARLAEFGNAEMTLLARVRVRTDNNCVPRDIVQVGDLLLFGYNVFLGLKKDTKVEDVFALFSKNKTEQGDELTPVTHASSFLAEPSFVNDFDELYRYYKNTRLLELSVNNGKLLAGFQIGERLEDVRVFRWSIADNGNTLRYIDNRGERDLQLPPAYDFEWQTTSRDDVVQGRHPHVNIQDTVFVETIGGDLTIKVENNTEVGLGIYREPVEDQTQSLDDASIEYAAVGHLILLKIRPYREEQWRYLVFNQLTQQVLRIDNIGHSCVQLPENHGLIFPGGMYLNTGEVKIFDQGTLPLTANFRFKRMLRSPNGEDVLYVFYEPEAGMVALLGYNLIDKQLHNPLYAHGYALADDGEIVLFTAEAEATRIHPLQIWQTPYQSLEFASQAPPRQNFYGRIGNPELVRGVADFYALVRMIDNQSVSMRLYETLSQTAKKMADTYHWLQHAETQSIATLLKSIAATAELVIDEFEKVESIRHQSAKAMQQAEQTQTQILQAILPEQWTEIAAYVDALNRLRQQRGQLATIKTLRYIDQDRIALLDQQILTAIDQLSQQTVTFLADAQALTPYITQIAVLNQQVETVATQAEILPLIASMESTAVALDLLSELIGTLTVDDATLRTRIIDAISDVYGQLNQGRAKAKHRQQSFGSQEAIAQFAAQFKLFSQSITHALGLATTPENCDEQLAKCLIRLEELEGQFNDYPQFLTDIIAKREAVYESFQEHKQRLLDDRQKKTQTLLDAATRILSSIEKRSLAMPNVDALNTYFAADALVLKVRELMVQLQKLDNSAKADDIDARFKAIKEQALRALRDKNDIFEDDGAVIKLGPRHKFSVNTQALDLTILPRDGVLNFHLTGTDYFALVQNAELIALQDYGVMTLESESQTVYRAEYLAALILEAAEQQTQNLSMAMLRTTLVDDDRLVQLVRDFAVPRYKEGYQKGVHDQDAALILKHLVPALDRAELLKFDPLARGLAQVFWVNRQKFAIKSKMQNAALSFETWRDRALCAQQMQSTFGSPSATQLLVTEIAANMQEFITLHPLRVTEWDIQRASAYLVAELARERVEFITSKYAVELVEMFQQALDEPSWRQFHTVADAMQGNPAPRWQLACACLQAVVEDQKRLDLQRYIPEAVVLIEKGLIEKGLIDQEQKISRRMTQVDVELRVGPLLGEHALIQDRHLAFAVDTFMQRLTQHREQVLPQYQRYLQLRQQVIEQERKNLRLTEFKAKPLSSFVRNRLINEAYLPIIGDNLAKQMGALGANKRTDLMGLLMMISPPGYGKTTLMEYIANRLGLIFMKINCPSLGHEVLSVDPAQAPNATARQELLKLNLALEMGNNVMLYLDDIQHTHPEFLQKFIALCDGTRRMEGVWQGQTKTYDMRGKKFCVCMAGNPYTESGEAFKVPDMLANRADIYNLGDILGGMDQVFALSYIENALTSNAILAPLALRDMQDVYRLIGMVKGEQIAITELSHDYSNAEVQEMLAVLRKLLVVQNIVLKINQQYIASAAQDDRYRVEPTFKLQGSYRNMNKMAEKVSAVMNDDELMQMIADHYLGEAQMLTTAAESNLLKLAELRGNMTVEQQARWQAIKHEFLRHQAMGGDDADVGGKVVVQLADMVAGIQQLVCVAQTPTSPTEIHQPLPGLNKIFTALADTIESSMMPLMRNMDKKMEIDLRNHDKMQEISNQLRQLEASLGANRTKATQSTPSGPASP
jgi:hypothetical protein